MKISRVFLSALVLLMFSVKGESGLFFSDMEYEEFIRVDFYLLNKEQVANLFLGNTAEVVQPDYRDLDKEHLYAAILFKNNGNKSAWGIVNISISGRKIPNLNVLNLSPNMEEFSTYIIPLHGIILPQTETHPKLEIIWKELDTK